MRVYAHNTDTGETLLKEVLQTFVNETDELIYVTVVGEEIVTTPSHPFYVPKQGWTDAIHLKAGDILLTVNGEYVVVEKAQHELLESPIKVYNFEVEDFHTYYVGDGVLVHNTCATQRGLARQKAAKMTNGKKITINGRDRIPDYLSDTVLGEAKSVRYLSKTSQLTDMFTYGHDKGYKMFLKVEKWTKISGPLREFLDDMGVAINVF